ncbi:MAG: sigma-E factor negative regulatory protein [Hydrogenophaga sp.]|nr:sigma-E factor negative regulatory protein [Hydrogenophaga sp.]
MNAAQEHTLHTPATPSGEANELPTSALSALVDGELHTDDEWEQCLTSAGTDDDGWTAQWASYHVIGDVLRGSPSVLAAQAPADFLAGVRKRLAAEEARPLPTVVPQPLAVLPVAGHVRAPAANDAVFRWKMVAGFASLAAVMAVSWTLLGTAPGSAGNPASGGQMALLDNPSVATQPPAAALTSPPTQEVLVSTPQGMVIRDAQLEERLAEHRQYGGMSALQMPAGFLRNATYDAPGR